MNVRAGSDVEYHRPVREQTGYDLDVWSTGPDDPMLLWIQITPTYVSLHRYLGANGSSVSRP